MTHFGVSLANIVGLRGGWVVLVVPVLAQTTHRDGRDGPNQLRLVVGRFDELCVGLSDEIEPGRNRSATDSDRSGHHHFQ
jgi:hypothetical protein